MKSIRWQVLAPLLVAAVIAIFPVPQQPPGLQEFLRAGGDLPVKMQRIGVGREEGG